MAEQKKPGKNRKTRIAGQPAIRLMASPSRHNSRLRVPVSVSHVAIGESSKELAKLNLWILAILVKSINISFS